VEQTNTFDVIIVGAGPAGTSCALTLDQSGLKVLLVDKSDFPRDKTCGDAIPGPSLRVLRKLFGPDELLEELVQTSIIKASTLYYKEKRALSIHWVTKALNIPRETFDNYLFNKVKTTKTNLLTGTRIRDVNHTGNQVEITTFENQTYYAKMIVACDGANSIVARKLQTEPNPNQQGVALRAYFKNIDFDRTQNHFLVKKNFPGYFWVFPVGQGLYNVGYGMPTDKKEKGQNIQQQFWDIIANDKLLKEKFKNGEIIDGIKGHKLPMGGRKQAFSGNNFLLTGDAAFLVDPLWGHGIDKAMISGNFAAEHIIQCFKHKKFDGDFNKKYDSLIHEKLGKDLRNSLWLRNFLLANLWFIPCASFWLKLLSKRCR
jgi:geranylgeranyl reductase family protein